MDNSAKEYADNVEVELREKNIEKLAELYKTLGEEENIDKAKRMCLKLYSTCFDEIIKQLKDDEHQNIEVKYYMWHFLQLLTSCPEVKEKVQTDEDLLPRLIDLNFHAWEDQKEASLHSITINYIAFIIGEANDSFYNHIASTQTIPYLHKLFSNCTLSCHDNLVESILLALNLLLEGTSSCKKQLNDLDFANLVIKKIYERTDCSDDLLKVAHLTYQKLLMLTTDKKRFVETFRKGFTEESKKHDVFQPPIKCSNSECKQTDVTSFKRCSRCKLVSYCSRDCQIEHWKKGHSKKCVLSTI